VAIKIIDVENAEDEVEDIIQEISILSELHSPYVTKYHGSFLKGSDLWIIMEFCSGGSCSDLMRPGLIPEDYICIIIRELLMGLEYLHGDKKLHRDIKGSHHAPFAYRRLTNTSRQHTLGCKWPGQVGGLWCVWSALSNHDQEEYVCWNTFLDGTGGDQTIRL
jgi:serine/threonine protein kinase